MLIHYGLNNQDLRQKYKSNGSFATAHDGLAPICGNGSYHANSTRDKNKITCPACIKKITKEPS